MHHKCLQRKESLLQATGAIAVCNNNKFRENILTKSKNTKRLKAEKEAATEANKIAMELTEEWDDKVREIEEINNAAILSEKLKEAEDQIFKYETN